MLRLTLAQMRHSRGRLLAGGVAVGIACAFVTVTFLAGSVLGDTAYAALSAKYAEADLVVEGSLSPAMATRAAGIDGVAAVEPLARTLVEIAGPDGTLWVEVMAPAQDPRLESRDLLKGVMPSTGEVALPGDIAQIIGVTLGDTVTVHVDSLIPTGTQPATGDEEPAWEQHTEDLTVVGILDTTASSLFGESATVLAGSADVSDWLGNQALTDDQIQYQTLLVLVDDGTAVADVQSRLTAELAQVDEYDDLVVLVPQEQAERSVEAVTGGTDAITAIGMSFAAVALLVAALVISNTFQVLVAQRTRTLALLRCVGADRSQLRRSVVIEAVVLGTIAAVFGIGLSLGVAQVALMVFAHTAPQVPLPPVVPMTLASIAVPLLIGVGVTVVAALAPARAATRVSPLAAMRPSDVPGMSSQAGRVRAWLAATLTAAGVGAMAIGIQVSGIGRVSEGLAIAVLGGGLSFVGLLLSAVFWLPRLVGAAANTIGRFGGASARLAAANSTRNPRRVSATGSALLIGVTLVVMMATGAQAARSAFSERLDNKYPVDIEAATMSGYGEPTDLPEQFTDTVRNLPGVAHVATLTEVIVDVGGEFGMLAEYQSVVGADDSVGAVLRAPDQIAEMDARTVIVPQAVADRAGISDGQELTLTVSSMPDDARDGEAGSAGDESITVTAAVTPLNGDAFILPASTLRTLAPDAPTSRLWVQVDDHSSAVEVVGAIQSAAARSTNIYFQGPVVEHAAWEKTIDMMLAVVLGLLAASVVIALVGVANTLSLSVIERRRELATLRAIGLTRGQLRTTLALEGTVIAGVGGIVGTVLGMVYGWLGAHVILMQVGSVGFAVPWREVVVVLVGAALAGLAASVFPARSAVRTPPVEALAVE